MKKITLLIADDHPIVRAGLRQVLEANSAIVIIGEAENGEKALRCIKEQSPDIALLDINMPKMTGLHIAELLSKEETPTQLIIMTQVEDEQTFLKAVDVGVRGYLMKDSALLEIVLAIQSVAAGKFYLSPELSQILIQHRMSKPIKKELSLIAELNETERKILLHIADLKSNKEIAEAMFLSKRTVENNKVSISRKLGLSGTHNVLKFALEHKHEL
ncbi:MAG: response regulator transcription factor [Ignavibacteriae bacterium]|nr:response regulator transcription factor [Ignavibacteriota bacterium]